MQAADASKIVNFMTKVKLDNDSMKAWFGNAMNALMSSTDPVSVRFCQTLNEAINQSAVTVLNEAAGVPVPPVIPGSRPAARLTPPPPGQATPAAICEAFMDHAAKLMV